MKKLAFLSDGEMMVLENGEVRKLHSERKDAYIRTARSLEERNAWKYEGAGAKFQMRENPYERQARIAGDSCTVGAIALWRERLVYALFTPDMGGIYVKDTADDNAPESSWLSDRSFRVTDMHVQGEQTALALGSVHGERHIALMKTDSARYEVLTQGDTEDSTPFLMADGCMLYASAGWARDENGSILAKGNSEILQLNLCTGEVDTVLSDERYDYLRPKVGPDGARYVIRRPYTQEGPKRISPIDRVKHFGAAIKGLGKLLAAIGDPEGSAKRAMAGTGKQQEVQRRMLEGALVDISRPADAPEDEPILKGWTLLKETAPGQWEEVLQGAADYDFDGSALVYSDGRRILRDEDGQKTVLYKGVFIPRIVVG